MNSLQVFSNSEFGEVRSIEIGGKPHFVGADIARALGYADTINAIKQHCRGVVKHHIIDNLGRKQLANVIPEGDLYRLIVNSQLPGAEKFERWVFDEVLPSIRKHGAYMTPETLEAAILNPDTMIRVLTALKDEQAKVRTLSQQAEADKPKILFADAVSVSSSTCLIGELAKILKGNGIDIGQNRLFEKLRRMGYLIRRSGADYNMPTQRAMELGLFKIKETAVTHSDGHVSISRTPKVTGKGQQYFINMFLAQEPA